MSTSRADYNALREVLQEFPREQVKPPDIPVAVFAQEAVNLAAWARHDREELTAAGLDWALVESLSQRAGALRQAHSLY